MVLVATLRFPWKNSLILLWYLGTIEPYTSKGERFGIAPSAAFNTVKRVSQALVDNYVGEFIKWPTGNRYEDVMAGFEEKHGIPGVVGAIDGTHIPIKAPTLKISKTTSIEKNFTQ